MNNSCFRVNIVTPSKKFYRDIVSIRLKDETGFFGVMKGHADFLTVLVPSLGYYTDQNGREVFLAVDVGVFGIRGGTATLASREVFENEDAKMLSEIIETTMSKRRAAEAAFFSMIEGIEQTFIEKSLEIMRIKM